MQPPAATDTRELGLELGLLALRYFAGTDALHYGLWDEDLPPCLGNIAEAQRRYTEFLLTHIPAEATSILDVGCGAGVVAQQLIERGHNVTCVSPSSVLAARTRERLGDAVEVHECRFEELETPAQFDVVLFSESFQYIPMDIALPNARALLRPGGSIVICDFFKTEAAGKGPMGGGHRYTRFAPAVRDAGLETAVEMDITARVAPTMAVYDQLRAELVGPSTAIIGQYAGAHYPRMSRLAAWFMRRRLERFQRKYLSGERNPEAFSHWKSYRLIVLRAQQTPPSR
ncbi:MAG: class I SAM-dependent methyltransferase [Algiphilus sp.]